MTRLWNDRLMWSNEVPLSFPGLNPVAYSRLTPKSEGIYADEVNSSRIWQLHTSRPAGNTFHHDGPWKDTIQLNIVDPAVDKSRLTLPYFSGMWPNSQGKVFVGLWSRQRYTMTFTPYMSTRGGPGHPLLYLSASSAGNPRHGVYDASGNLVLDTYEKVPWTQSMEWIWYGQLVDMKAQTSQLIGVQRGNPRPFIGPVRPLSGPPNPSAKANLDVLSLQSAGYWTTSLVDELMLAHPRDDFDVTAFARRLALSTWANAQMTDANQARILISDTRIQATKATTVDLGAEEVNWRRLPTFRGLPAGSTAYRSTNGGDTWTTSTAKALPEKFSGLLRWRIPLKASETFSGIDVIEPSTPPPTLQPIADVELSQNSSATRHLLFKITGPATWSVTSSGLTDVQRVGNQLTINSGWEIGSDVVTVTLTDEYQQSTSRTFAVTVSPAEAPTPAGPIYPRAPIILWDENSPQAVLAEPLSGVIVKETDGEETFTFTMFADDPLIEYIKHEERVTCAGETYRIRRVTDIHSGSQLIKQVFCEAMFYDLASARQIDGREFKQVSAGAALEFALKGTGWTVGIANVSTLRSYEIEDTNPLEFVRFIRSRHGGELIFDNENKTVSLLTSSGRDNGVTFFYGHGLSEAKRVVDTSSLVTRIYAKNAEGVTIASVNRGLPYVEDYSFTDELKTATYDFASGTNPYTMLQMASATLANRSQPDVSYEVTVDDLSYESGNEIDRFDVRDYVRVVDEDLEMNTLQRIVGLEYDVVRPWASRLTLAGKLREVGSGTDTVDAGVLTTGVGATTFDLVPYNLLLNGRFDNSLNHWARFGVDVEEVEQGTSDYSAVFRGSGERWIEQTVQVDNRDAFALSLDVESAGGPQSWVPNLVASAVITYEDGSTENIEIELA